MDERCDASARDHLTAEFSDSLQLSVEQQQQQQSQQSVIPSPNSTCEQHQQLAPIEPATTSTTSLNYILHQPSRPSSSSSASHLPATTQHTVPFPHRYPLSEQHLRGLTVGSIIRSATLSEPEQLTALESQRTAFSHSVLLDQPLNQPTTTTITQCSAPALVSTLYPYLKTIQ